MATSSPSWTMAWWAMAMVLRPEAHWRFKVAPDTVMGSPRSEEHTSELQSRENLVCRPPRPTLFPYTTLFRSLHQPGIGAAVAVGVFVLQEGDGFDAAADGHLQPFMDDGVVGHGDGVEAGGALAVQGGAGHGDGQPEIGRAHV